GVGGHLAGFHQLLEAMKIAPRLHFGLALEQFGAQSSQCAPRGLIGEDEMDVGPPAARGIVEAYLAAVCDIAFGLALPADRLAGYDAGDAVDERHLPPRGRLYRPARYALAERLNRHDILHELREALASPRGEERRCRPVGQKRFSEQRARALLFQCPMGRVGNGLCPLLALAALQSCKSNARRSKAKP